MARHTIAYSKTCSAEGCTASTGIVRGMCRNHYAAFYRSGHFKFGEPPSLEERFWLKVTRGPHPKGCWEWMASYGTTGYGQIAVAPGIPDRAHRVAYALTFGKIPKGKWVLHTCDNRKCVNPDHLWIGTRIDNIKDAVQKGRNVHGENHHWSKLKSKQVVEIRASFSTGRYSKSVLCKKYGVSFATMQSLLLRKTWKNVG